MAPYDSPHVGASQIENSLPAVTDREPAKSFGQACVLFNSYQFLIFFPVVTVLYFALPYRVRWAMLLAASCVFYMAFIPKYIFIPACSAFISGQAQSQGLGLPCFSSFVSGASAGRRGQPMLQWTR